ncbi:MAG: hypothetical protein N0C84_01020, partial [Candidatus Thiodiazotropha taylori]|nr:hypothetical protein [Candidatus Thiodiazotropha taylori]MCW4255027.1 hypothetical protein [Candidatus Thiodiazotropha taylori]
MEKKYYVYYWNREDGTPYYIGKGCGDRAYRKGRDYKPPVERIQILKENLTEDEALELEIELIAKFGRKDLGTGILRNKTDGGDGMSSEDATRLNNKRVAEGTHPMFKEHNKEKLRQRNKETGSFKNPELQRELFKRRTKESLIEGGKKAAETTRKNGTHPWKTENRSELHKKNLEA